MANINELLEANHGTYRALKDKNAIHAKINNFELVEYKYDSKSDHGAVAYYNPEDKSVLIAHRGSATFKDWMINNPKIAKEILGKPLETMADVSAKRFTNNVLEMLDRTGNEIEMVIQSGHSKGGRESQHSLIEVVDNLKLNSMGLTFNSAPIKHSGDKQYNHINLQLSGGSFYNSDVVSIVGKQLGDNYKVISSQIHNPISAHSLSSFTHIQNENKSFTQDQLSKIFEHVKSGKEYADYISQKVEEFKEHRTNTFYSIPDQRDKVADMENTKIDNTVNDRIQSQDSFLSTLDDNRKSIAIAVIDQLGGYKNFNKFAEENKNEYSHLRFENFIPNFKDFKTRIEEDAINNGYNSAEEYLKDHEKFRQFSIQDIKQSLSDETIDNLGKLDNKTINDIHDQIVAYSVESTIFDHQYYENLENSIANENGYNLTVVLSEDKEIHVIQQGIMDREVGEPTFNYDEQVKAEVLVIGQAEKIENFLEVNESKLQSKVNQIQLINATGNSSASLKGLEALAKNRLNIVRSEINEVKSFQSAHGVIVGHSEDKLYLVDNENKLYSFDKGEVVNKQLNISKLIEDQSKVELYNNGFNTRVHSVDNKSIMHEKHLDNTNQEKEKSSYKSNDGLELE